MPETKKGKDEDKPKMMKTKRIRARNQDKVRVHLPPIESYEKELEFQADGPGRVVVRLERLMGSDRIRITDTKYMSTLLERLEEQERKAWAKKRFGRVKVERNRYRQLAIDGLMEPADDMLDLYHHPVFRVNRVLQRISKMDNNITLTPLDKLPPIIPIDPFLYDDTGKAFKHYPGHQAFTQSNAPTVEMSIASSHTEISLDTKGEPKKVKEDIFFGEEGGGYEGEDEADPKMAPTMGTAMGTNTQFEMSIPSTMKRMLSTELPSEAPTAELSMATQRSYQKFPARFRNLRLSEAAVPTLSEVQRRYGVEPQSQTLEAEWGPFRSYLVDNVFHDGGQKVADLYQVAEDVLGVYHREMQTSDDFGFTLYRLMNK